jgi:hypothetical protein
MRYDYIVMDNEECVSYCMSESDLELIEPNTIEEDTQELNKILSTPEPIIRYEEVDDRLEHMKETPYIYEDGVLRNNEKETAKHLCALCDKEVGNTAYGSEFGFICEKCNDKKIPQTLTIDISKGCDNLTEVEKEVLDNFKGFDKIDVDSLKIEMLDYEKEYNLLLEEHEQTKELLEIAKIALKLTTELISTND